MNKKSTSAPQQIRELIHAALNTIQPLDPQVSTLQKILSIAHAQSV